MNIFYFVDHLVVVNSDFLVIGGGLAGLSFALEASEFGSVIILAKDSFKQSSSAWAQGGMSAVVSQEVESRRDSVSQHLKDTITAGCGLVNERVAEDIIAEGQDVVDFLLKQGVDFDQDASGFLLGKEGGHSTRRILHHKDLTGMEMTEKLERACRENPNITFYDDHYVIDLITTGKQGLVTDDRVIGCYALDEKQSSVKVVKSNRVLLAVSYTHLTLPTIA